MPAAGRPHEIVGRVLSVRGSQATLGLAEAKWNEPDRRRLTVGSLVGLLSGERTVVGVVTDTSIQTLAPARDQGFTLAAVVDLMGEMRTRPDKGLDRKRTRLNSSHLPLSRMPSS